ncbi:MAG: dTDP-4-dehydrorhamnose reductase [Oscillospiraceae bacterium]|nr:dTDP-4-dehydrorhamnose reductase [Oscillospiraceae bacterium]
MKILITGCKGQLGSELQRILAAGKSELGPMPEKLQKATVIASDLDTLDIANRHEVAVFLRRHQPDVVINCGAYTNVDGCEANSETAFKANAIGPRNLAMACAEIGAKLVHVSTDYVFSGDATAPVCEYDAVAPKSVYGKTKLLGEQYVQQFCTRFFIVRTAWLYGYQGNNFVKTMVKLGKERGAISVVNDQLGNPTNAVDLAHHILKLVVTKEYGVYHCTGKGICSWYDFAAEIIRLAGVNATVSPCTTQEYQKMITKPGADRPAYSALDNMMLRVSVGDEMRTWQDALKCYFKNWDGQ